MGAGLIDAWRAGIIAAELREAPRHVCEQVLDRVEGSLGQPGGVLRRRTRHHLERIDPRWLTMKASRARSQVGLRMVPGGDSTDTWTAVLPTEQSRQAGPLSNLWPNRSAPPKVSPWTSREPKR